MVRDQLRDRLRYLRPRRMDEMIVEATNRVLRRRRRQPQPQH